MQNPFTISFGKKPLQYVSRLLSTNGILEDFTGEISSNQVYMVTGIRGSGKTVLMTAVAAELSDRKDWIVLNINPEREMLESLAAKLYRRPQLHKLFVSAKLNLAILGFGAEVEQAAPITDIEDALELMLEQVKKAGKRLLVCVDEVTNNPNMRVFAGALQIFIREELPIYVLMTGLYENLYDLQNEKSLTFLYRAPKVVLEPLDQEAIRIQYKKTFGFDDELTMAMTRLTKGYPFAFQVLGYLCWKEKEDLNLEEVLPEYDQYLREFVYSKLWSELSAIDRRVICAMAESTEHTVKEIRKALGLNSEKFSVYRERLKRKGLVDTSQYGRMTLILPRFDVYALQMEREQ